MLLRASRSSEAITKEAILGTVGRIGRGLLHGVTKGTSGAARGVSGMGGSAIGRAARAVGWKAPAAVGLGTAVAAPMVASSLKRSKAGLRQDHLQQSRARGVSAAPESRAVMTPYGPQMQRF